MAADQNVVDLGPLGVQLNVCGEIPGEIPRSVTGSEDR